MLSMSCTVYILWSQAPRMIRFIIRRLPCQSAVIDLETSWTLGERISNLEDYQITNRIGLKLTGQKLTRLKPYRTFGQIYLQFDRPVICNFVHDEWANKHRNNTNFFLIDWKIISGNIICSNNWQMFRQNFWPRSSRFQTEIQALKYHLQWRCSSGC